MLAKRAPRSLSKRPATLGRYVQKTLIEVYLRSVERKPVDTVSFFGMCKWAERVGEGPVCMCEPMEWGWGGGGGGGGSAER